ncbi:hypothetical protein LCGC14_2393340 [marine sediment metagenome]|uniref:Zinc finger/thioredoxin putative domain-containing protein n=1 Tax=marine sediment metagenome TaxID=412755 RepID=A0A0F9CJK3_9ZZZZ
MGKTSKNMEVYCPKCKASYKIEDTKIPIKGAHINCPKCETRVFVNTESKVSGKVCPKCGYERQTEDDEFTPASECPKCSIIYSKAKVLPDNTRNLKKRSEKMAEYDSKIIKLSQKAILLNLGNIIDLPYDISNTVCNVYYRYFELFPDESIEEIKKRLGLFDDLLTEDADNPFTVGRINIDALEDTRKSGSIDSIVVGELVCLTKLIISLRAIRDHPRLSDDPTYYFGILELIPDIFKYKISRAFDKTPIRRKVERKLKANKVNEISHLVDFMEVRIEDNDLDNDYFDD